VRLLLTGWTTGGAQRIGSCINGFSVPLLFDRATGVFEGKVVMSRAAPSARALVGRRRLVPSDEAEPEDFDVLVLDAHSRQSLAAVRSLGRAGLRVATAECFAECDPALAPLAFRSRYTRRSDVLPSFAADAHAFAEGVLAFVRRNPTRMVLPASDGSIAALIGWRRQLEMLGCRLALPSEDALAAANDKGRTLKEADRLGIAYPPTVCCNSVSDLSTALRTVGFPAVLKPTRSWTPRTVERLNAVEVVNQSEAERAARSFLRAGAGVLAQRWIGGRREGATLFVEGGEVRASFAVVAHRTTPALGGASVLRESVPVPLDLYDPSVRLVKALGLEGPCEVEYRRDESGYPLLMEINARLAGPLETALRSGVDLPVMVWRWATGLPVTPPGDYRTVRMRWLRGDMRWLRDNFARVGRPDSVSRVRSLWDFGSEFARCAHYDCIDWRDPGPILTELRTTARSVRLSSRGRSVHDRRNGTEAAWPKRKVERGGS
jgi:predicted ATP-grasp superfamily ATP-dependent carboligase